MKARSSRAYFYIEVDSVSQDYEKAFYWVTKAAAQGCIYSECNLGYLHWSGKGTLEDYEKAFFWFSLAAEK